MYFKVLLLFLLSCCSSLFPFSLLLAHFSSCSSFAAFSFLLKFLFAGSLLLLVLNITAAAAAAAAVVAVAAASSTVPPRAPQVTDGSSRRCAQLWTLRAPGRLPSSSFSTSCAQSPSSTVLWGPCVSIVWKAVREFTKGTLTLGDPPPLNWRDSEETRATIL